MARKKSRAFLFIDTNSLIEFKNFDQIDWPKIMNYQQVCLVVAPVIFTELESLKYDPRSERKRERSRLISRKLDELIESTPAGDYVPIPGRSGTELYALTTSPNLAAFPGLQSHIQDDQLIASLLEFQRNHPEVDPADVVLASDDTGLRNKARARNISVFRLSEDHRLPMEVSVVQKELNAVKKELAELRSREPKLALGVRQNETLLTSLSTTIIQLEELPAQDIITLVEAETQATFWERPKPIDPQNKTPPASEFLAAIQQAQNIFARAVRPEYPEEEIQRYTQDRQRYLDELPIYSEQVYRWMHLLRRTRKVELTVVNDGAVPANNVVIKLIVPDGIEVNTASSLPKRPAKPQRPLFPRTAMEKYRIHCRVLTRELTMHWITQALEPVSITIQTTRVQKSLHTIVFN